MKITQKQRNAASLYWTRILLAKGLPPRQALQFMGTLDHLLTNADTTSTLLSFDSVGSLNEAAQIVDIPEYLLPRDKLSMRFDNEEHLIIGSMFRNGAECEVRYQKIKADDVLKTTDQEQLALFSETARDNTWTDSQLPTVREEASLPQISVAKSKNDEARARAPAPAVTQSQESLPKINDEKQNAEDVSTPVGVNLALPQMWCPSKTASSFQFDGAILHIDLAQKGARQFLILQPTPTTKFNIPYVVTKTSSSSINITVTINGQEKKLLLQLEKNDPKKIAKLHLMHSQTEGTQIQPCPALADGVTNFLQLAGHNINQRESKQENYDTPSQAVATGRSLYITTENRDHFYSKKMQEDYDTNQTNPMHLACGKWVLEFNDTQSESLDHIWKYIRAQVENGELFLAKAFKKQLTGKFAGQQSIIIYTHDHHDVKDLKRVLNNLKQGLGDMHHPKIYYKPEYYTHEQRGDYLYSPAFFEKVDHKPATRDNVKAILAKASAILLPENDNNSTPIQKNIANYILNQNQYALKHQNKFGYGTLFSLRTIARNNHENELAKLKLSIASYALDPKFNDEERKLIIKNSCLAAREYTGSLEVGPGVAFFTQKSPGRLEASVEKEPSLKIQPSR